MGPCFRRDDRIPARAGTTEHCGSRMNAPRQPDPADDVHLIVVKDEEVTVENYPENWIAFALFWSLAFIVFLQFFTRYILNDSLSWTEEIARYGLMSLAFIGGAVVTRKKSHIAVELLSNLMKPGPLRSALLALVDFVTLGFMALLAYFSVTIIERMQAQTMTVFERSEEHTSELQSLRHLVCRLLLVKKNKTDFIRRDQHFEAEPELVATRGSGGRSVTVLCEPDSRTEASTDAESSNRLTRCGRTPSE